MHVYMLLYTGTNFDRHTEGESINYIFICSYEHTYDIAICVGPIYIFIVRSLKYVIINYYNIY